LSSVKVDDEGVTTLVVPVDVVGLCIGENDYQQATNGFAGATAYYRQQVTGEHPAYLGDNVTRDYEQPPLDQLEIGVHLHWALPDGLTRGGGAGSELDFPPVPTRWLVTRVAVAGGKPSTRAWLVESDALSATQPPPTVSAVTVPVTASTQFPNGFAYLGTWHEIGPQGWSENMASNGPRLADVGGRPLNAVSNGEVGFAAYYPSCRGVLGFWDALDDVPAPASAPAQLAYSVIGWYDDEALDPVQAGATPAQLQTARGWTFAPGAAAPSRSVYNGVFQGISWSKYTDYVFRQAVQKSLPAQAAIGNTSSEALAAYFTARDSPGVPLFETLLDAFQSGLLETFKQPQPNALTALEERLHDQRFAGMAAGTVYSIVSTADTSPNPLELVDLPAPLADDLNKLNVMRGQADQCAFHADWFRWQLFADWDRIFMIDESGRNDAFAIASERYAAWDPLHAACETLATAANAQYDKVSAALGSDMLLRGAPATRFVVPSDPTVLITGDGVHFPERYGGDGRFDKDGYLVCRTDGEPLVSVAVGQTTLAASSLTGVVAPAGVPAPALVTALLREACMLSTALLAQLTGDGAAALQAALELALEGKAQDVYVLAGRRPRRWA
jgi:hypothetical protein